MQFIKNNFKYLGVFIFCVSVLVIFAFDKNSYDSIWNYGFSYSIAKGQIPYKDFTMLITPLYNFIMSLGLVFFSHNNIVFLIEQALIITVNFYFLYKMFKEKAWCFLFFMCFPFCFAFMPSYNYFIFFLVTIILYLERNDGNDYLIGLFLGLVILTKHTVGIFLLIPSAIIYFQDIKKLVKRFIGVIIPCFVFLIYLICTNSLYQFIDICFLGLFDFANSNSFMFTSYFFISILFLFITIYLIFRDKKNILYWYVLFSFLIMIPIFNAPHFSIYMLFFSLLIISNIPDYLGVYKNYIKNVSLLLSLITVIFSFCLDCKFVKLERMDGVRNFNYLYVAQGSETNLLKVNDLYHKYKRKANTLFLSSKAVWLRIVNEEKTDYFTILNTGNYGYNGSDKMIKRLEKQIDTYYIVDMKEYEQAKSKSTYTQFDCKIIDYIIDNCSFVESVYDYNIYYSE